MARKVITPEATFSYPHLFKPQAAKEGDQPLVMPLPAEPPPAPSETLITLSPLAASDTHASPPRRMAERTSPWLCWSGMSM